MLDSSEFELSSDPAVPPHGDAMEGHDPSGSDAARGESDGAEVGGKVGKAVDEDVDEQEGDEAGEDEAEGEAEDDDEDREPDPIEVGTVRNGRRCVCHGDDSPTEFDYDLQVLVEELRMLQSLVWEHKIQHDGSSELDDHTEVNDFLEMIGVELDSDFWEGACTSGYYQYGWVREDSFDKLERKSRRLLDQYRRSITKAIRARIRERLRECDEIEELAVLAYADVLANFSRLPKLERDFKNLEDECKALKENIAYLRRKPDSPR